VTREYTVEEANDLIPTLAATLVRIKEARVVVVRGAQQVKPRTNGGGAWSQEYWDALDTLRREVERLNDQGLILRDADSGLVDFPSRREGREVFLCWRLGEDTVAHWHGPESGFSGRKPL
jgi:hypothetical protein